MMIFDNEMQGKKTYLRLLCLKLFLFFQTLHLLSAVVQYWQYFCFIQIYRNENKLNEANAMHKIKWLQKNTSKSSANDMFNVIYRQRQILKHARIKMSAITVKWWKSDEVSEEFFICRKIAKLELNDIRLMKVCLNLDCPSSTVQQFSHLFILINEPLARLLLDLC